MRAKSSRDYGQVEGLVGDEGDEMRDHPDEDGYAENASRRDQARLAHKLDERRDRERRRGSRIRAGVRHMTSAGAAAAEIAGSRDAPAAAGRAEW
ncbi:MAG: hypothetical protein U1E30_03055 [Rhodoblastus sp.]